MSSIPAVKAALVTILTTALPNTQVIYGPGSSVSTTTPRILVVGETITGQLTSLTIDNSTGSEEYEVRLLASVSIGGNDAALADTEVMADFTAAVAAIKANPQLGGLNVSAKIDGTFDMSAVDTEYGRATSVSFPVAIYAAN